MGKNKICIRLVFVIAFYANSIVVHAQLKQRVVDIYTAEIGVRELTGNNDGARVIEYLKAANLTKGNPWCAAFITWTFKQGNVKAVVSGYSPSWFPKSNTIYTKGQKNNRSPDKADVFGIWFQSKNRIAHVGFVDEWTEGVSYAITVEGNTNDAGSREGDGVYRKRRLKSQIYKVSRWLN